MENSSVWKLRTQRLVYHLFFNLLINGLLLLINGFFFIISLLFYLQTWSESYRKSVLERLFSQRANAPARKKKLVGM